MLNTKSQGLSLNVIIIAAIVLIVLVVLWAIFTGRMGYVSKELKRCKGTCENPNDCLAVSPEGDCPKVIGKQSLLGYNRRTLTGQDQVCCALVSKNE